MNYNFEDTCVQFVFKIFFILNIYFDKVYCIFGLWESNHLGITY